MKKINSAFLATAFTLTLAVMTTAGAVSSAGMYNPGPVSITTPSSTITTTAGAAPTSTAGIINPAPGTIGVSPLIAPTSNQLQIGQQPGATTNTNTVCVDSGVQGRRCGIEAMTFCKLNPQAANCQTINSDTNSDTNLIK